MVMHCLYAVQRNLNQVLLDSLGRESPPAGCRQDEARSVVKCVFSVLFYVVRNNAKGKLTNCRF